MTSTYAVTVKTVQYLQVSADSLEEAESLALNGQGDIINEEVMEITDSFFLEEDQE